MKKFISKTIIFLVLGIVPALLFLLSAVYMIKEKSNFKISDKIDKIVIGHSHSECAFNDTIIPNFANFSSSGESYFYN